MKTDQSPELTQFYRDYLAWIDAGAPEPHEVFSRSEALCVNYQSWQIAKDTLDASLYKFGLQFTAAGLSTLSPFNSELADLIDEQNRAACHLNPKRIAWVRTRVSP